MGLFGSIAGIFGATQQANAAKESAKILNANRQQALQWAGQYDEMAQPWMASTQDALARAQGGLAESRAVGPPTQVLTGQEGMLANLMAQAQGLDVGEGLSGADRIALEDAQRVMNENLSATGNLRSGAAGFANAELTRRVLADANQRRFERSFNKMQLLFGGQQAGASQSLQGWQLGLQKQNQLVSQALARAGVDLQSAQLSGNIGQNFNQMGYGMRGSAIGLAPAMAQAEQAKGAAFANQIGSVGAVADDTLNMAAGAFMGLGGMGGLGGGATGALAGGALGGQNLLQYQLMQNLFRPQPGGTPGMTGAPMGGSEFYYLTNQGKNASLDQFMGPAY
jgi:hypothetical protein